MLYFEKFKCCCYSVSIENNLFSDHARKVTLYKVDKYCEKITELPHMKIDDMKNNQEFELVDVQFDV